MFDSVLLMLQMACRGPVVPAEEPPAPGPPTPPASASKQRRPAGLFGRDERFGDESEQVAAERDRLFDQAQQGFTDSAGQLTPAGRINRIKWLQQIANVVEAELTVEIDAYATARRDADHAADAVGKSLVGRTVGTEIGLACGTSPAAATHRVTIAETLVADHPQLLARARAGHLSGWECRLVTRETMILSASDRRRVDRWLTRDLQRRRLLPTQLANAAARRTLQADPDAADKRARNARSTRRISARHLRDGVGELFMRTRAEEVTAVHTSLDSWARARRADGDPRPLTDLMCDRLIELATGLPINPEPAPSTGSGPSTDGDSAGADPDSDDSDSAGADAGTGKRPVRLPDLAPTDLDPADPVHDDYPTSPTTEPGAGERDERRRTGRSDLPTSRMRAKVELQVVVSASALLGIDHAPALLRGYGAIPDHVLAAIIDGNDTTIRRLICDPVDGRLISMEARTRRFEGTLRDFKLYSDQHCRVAGTPIRAIDHINDHQHGGPTAAANGQGLSTNSHVIKDHPGITASALPPETNHETGHERPDPSCGARPPGCTCPCTCSGVDPGPEPGRPGPRRPTLEELRANAPTVRWTMPTGHHYDLAPPPALGHGSDPVDDHRERAPFLSLREASLRMRLRIHIQEQAETDFVLGHIDHRPPRSHRPIEYIHRHPDNNDGGGGNDDGGGSGTGGGPDTHTDEAA